MDRTSPSRSPPRRVSTPRASKRAARPTTASSKSIYFFDPNGVRLELTCRIADETELRTEEAGAHAKLAQRRREHGFAA
jgi:hypothetical protein